MITIFTLRSRTYVSIFQKFPKQETAYENNDRNCGMAEGIIDDQATAESVVIIFTQGVRPTYVHHKNALQC